MDDHVNLQRRPPALVEVETGGRGPAGDGTADVDEISVTVGAGTEHRVGEDDGVGLAPGDLVAQRRAFGELERSTGPGGAAPHRLVGVHQRARLVGQLSVAAEEAGMEKVEGRDVEGGGNRNPGSQVGKLGGEVETGLPVIQAAVDVGCADVEETLRSHRPTGGNDEVHRHGDSRPKVAGEGRLIGLAEKHEFTIRCPLDQEPAQHRTPRHDA